MSRRDDWEARLSALIVANARRPHEYARWDCLLWPAEAVKAQTGKDHGRGHRRKYDSLASAYRHLKEMGHDGPESLLDSKFEQKPVGFAQRGDLVLVELPEGALNAGETVPGVCIGADALVIVESSNGFSGLARFPRALWRKAWAV